MFESHRQNDNILRGIDEFDIEFNRVEYRTHRKLQEFDSNSDNEIT